MPDEKKPEENKTFDIPIVIYGYMQIEAKSKDEAEVKARAEFWNKIKGELELNDYHVNDAEVNP